MPENSIPALRDFLVQRYEDLKQRLTRQLGSSERASDALQDTWLRLESREKIEGVRNLDSFLMRMAVNVAIDHHRSNSRLLEAEEIETLLALADPAPGPEQKAVARAEVDLLVQALEELPPRRRKIFMMVRWEGMPQRDVATRMRLSMRTIEKELKTAHDYCAARLNPPPEE
jgi:RNA polymerase sigma factor (sigma-70 family)